MNKKHLFLVLFCLIIALTVTRIYYTWLSFRDAPEIPEADPKASINVIVNDVSTPDPIRITLSNEAQRIETTKAVNTTDQHVVDAITSAGIHQNIDYIKHLVSLIALVDYVKESNIPWQEK